MRVDPFELPVAHPSQDCSPERLERLWDAFEALEAAAARVAFGDIYMRKADQNRLKHTLLEYRKVRDESVE